MNSLNWPQSWQVLICLLGKSSNHYNFSYTGWQQSFHTNWMWICGSLAHVNKNCRKLQILIGIITTFSENFIQNKQVWPQLQPKTWSEAILRMYRSLNHFIIDSLQKCFLEAVIDCLEIQSWLKSEIVPNLMSSLSKAASKMHFWRLSMIKWCKLLYILKINHWLVVAPPHPPRLPKTKTTITTTATTTTTTTTTITYTLAPSRLPCGPTACHRLGRPHPTTRHNHTTCGTSWSTNHDSPPTTLLWVDTTSWPNRLWSRM